MAASSSEMPELRQEMAKVVVCGHCMRTLAQEFFFTCLKCEASYCYIHMSRHLPAGCARRTRRNKREEAVDDPGMNVDHSKSLIPLVVATAGTEFGSSANV
jgi:hypothetical protein